MNSANVVEMETRLLDLEAEYYRLREHEDEQHPAVRYVLAEYRRCYVRRRQRQPEVHAYHVAYNRAWRRRRKETAA